MSEDGGKKPDARTHGDGEALPDAGSDAPSTPPAPEAQASRYPAAPPTQPAAPTELPLETILLRPPPGSDEPLPTVLLSPPRGPTANPLRAPRPHRDGFGELLGRGFGAVRRAPSLVVPVLAGRWLLSAALWAPVVVAFGAAVRRMERGEDPLVALATVVTSPRTLYPAVGLGLSAALLGLLATVVTWAGTTRVFAADLRSGGARAPRGTFARGVVEGFARFVPLGLAVGVVTVAWYVATLSTAMAAGSLYLDALAVGRGGGAAAAALALALALGAVGTPVLRVVGVLAAARVGIAGSAALPALHEAVGLLGRRPFTIAGLSILVWLGAGMIAGTLTTPAALIPIQAGAWVLAVRWSLERLADVVLAYAELTELAAFSALVAAGESAPATPTASSTSPATEAPAARHPAPTPTGNPTPTPI